MKVLRIGTGADAATALEEFTDSLEGEVRVAIGLRDALRLVRDEQPELALVAVTPDALEHLDFVSRLSQALHVERGFDPSEAEEPTAEQVDLASRLQQIAEIADVGAWELSVRTEDLRVSGRLAELFDLDEADLPAGGSALLARVPSEDQDRIRDALTELSSSGRELDLFHRVEHRDGSQLWVHSRARLFHAPDGTPDRMVGVVQNVTQERLAQQRLEEAESTLRAVFDLSRDYIFLHGGDFRILEVNSRVLERYQCSLEDLQTMPPTTFMGQSFTYEEARDRFLRALEGQPQSFSWVGRALDGEEFNLEMHLQRYLPPPGPNRSKVRVIAVGRDVTEERRLENELRQAQRVESLGRLTGALAHDLNNILSVVISCSDLLLSDPELPSSAREDAEQIQVAGMRASELTQKMLAFGRKQSLAPILVDANEAVASTHRLLRRLLEDDVELEMQPHPAPSWVRVDPNQLEQVLVNLAVNAREAMPDGGRLSLRVGRIHLSPSDARALPELEAGDFVTVTVTDTGRGMDAKTASQALDPFFTTKDPGRGSGLGLPTAHGIVRQSGGQLQVESTLGAGTTVTVYLPRVTESEAQKDVPEAGPAPSAQASGQPATVLVVEDQTMVRNAAARILTRAGHRVWTAASGAEALELMRERGAELDLLLADLLMPQMSGLEVAKRLRGVKPDLRIVFMSGQRDFRAVREELSAGRVRFLAKPFTAASLAETIAELLDAEV